jgi:hypothetical protein
VFDAAQLERARNMWEVIPAEIPMRPQGPEFAGLCPFHREKSPSFFVVPHKGFFHCFAGDTLIPTHSGRTQIGGLVGTMTEVLTPHGWRHGFFDSFGRQELVELVLTRNGEERAEYTTAGHLWFVRGRIPPIATSDLYIGARLQATTLPRRSDWSLDAKAIAHGIVFGDGSLDGEYGKVNLHDEKISLVEYFWPLGVGGRPHNRNNGHHYLSVYGGRLFEGFKSLPSPCESDEVLLGFIAGWIATDGCVDDRGAVTLNCSVRESLCWVRDVALRLGLETSRIHTAVRTGYGRTPTPTHTIEFRRGTFDASMLLRQDHYQRFAQGRVQFERKRWVVREVRPTGQIKEVFCAQVPEHHAFGLDDDLLTSNCHGCGAHGTAIDYIMRTRNLGFTEAVQLLLNLPPQRMKTYRTTPRRTDRADVVARAREIWAEATTDYRLVPLYLYSRWLPDTPPPTIREHPALFCPKREARMPALVAAFQASSGRVTAVQRIWLEDRFEVGNDKGSRIPDAPKMAKGVLGDGAMRLARPGPLLGLAEGLETALACLKLFRTPTWGLGGLSRLGYPAHLTMPTDGSKPRRVESRAPSVWVPDEVRQLFIFGDGNEIGRTVAEFAAEWFNRAWRGTGRRAEAVLPEVGYGDFQDKLRVAVMAGAIR